MALDLSKFTVRCTTPERERRAAEANRCIKAKAQREWLRSSKEATSTQAQQQNIREDLSHYFTSLFDK